MLHKGIKKFKSFLLILISSIVISSCKEILTSNGVWEREVNQVENIQEKDSLDSFESALLEEQGEKSSEIVKEEAKVQKEEVKLTKEAMIVAIIFVSCSIALYINLLYVLFARTTKT